MYLERLINFRGLPLIVGADVYYPSSKERQELGLQTEVSIKSIKIDGGYDELLDLLFEADVLDNIEELMYDEVQYDDETYYED